MKFKFSLPGHAFLIKLNLHEIAALLYRLNITLVTTNMADLATRRFSGSISSSDFIFC